MLESIQQALVALNRFVDLLQQEQQALIEGDADRLLALSQLKIHQSEQLDLLERDRKAWLMRQGFDPQQDGMARWLAQQPANVTATWNSLLETARQAQRLNQENGKLIETHLQHNQQMLAALMHATHQFHVYGPDGQTSSSIGPGSRIIGKV